MDVLDISDIPVKIRISEAWCLFWFKRGKTQADLARLSGLTPQWISEYVQKSPILSEMVEHAEDYKRALNDVVAIKAGMIADGILSAPDASWNKKDLSVIAVTSGIFQDKNQKATQVNIQINTGSVIVGDIFKSLFPKSGSKQVETSVIEVASGSEPGNIPPLEKEDI